MGEHTRARYRKGRLFSERAFTEKAAQLEVPHPTSVIVDSQDVAKRAEALHFQRQPLVQNVHQFLLDLLAVTVQGCIPEDEGYWPEGQVIAIELWIQARFRGTERPAAGLIWRCSAKWTSFYLT